MKRIFQLLLCLCSAALVPSALAQGTIVFNNFRANNTYDQRAGAGITFLLSRVAFPFTPQITGSLSSVELPVFTLGGANAADISVRATDPANGFPGATLELFAERGGVRSDSSPDKSPTTYSSSLRPVLTAGTEYWLEVAAPQDASLIWYAALWSAPMRGYISAVDGQSIKNFTEPSAFRITVDPIPEATPRTILLAAALILGFRRIANTSERRAISSVRESPNE